MYDPSKSILFTLTQSASNASHFSINYKTTFNIASNSAFSPLAYKLLFSYSMLYIKAKIQ